MLCRGSSLVARLHVALYPSMSKRVVGGAKASTRGDAMAPVRIGGLHSGQLPRGWKGRVKHSQRNRGRSRVQHRFRRHVIAGLG